MKYMKIFLLPYLRTFFIPSFYLIRVIVFAEIILPFAELYLKGHFFDIPGVNRISIFISVSNIKICNKGITWKIVK